ncbi:MAG: hypothetical protein MZU95_07490 [Desulfomicrobium escambiense]|nr:hypothetical protein [Desulfomicrobium escambiense]
MINIGVASSATATGARTWSATSRRRRARTVAAGHDLDPSEARAGAASAIPAVKTTTDYQRPARRSGRSTPIAIATPVNTHFELGMAALRAGKHSVAREADDRDLRARRASWSRRPSAQAAC